MVRQITDKADGVRQKQLRAVRHFKFSRCRVKRCKQLVLRKDARTRQRIEQRGFAGVGITGDSNLGQSRFLALLALCCARRLEIADVLLQRGNAAPDMSAVGFQLGFTGTARTDTAAQTRHFRTVTGQTRDCIFQLCKLDLQLPLGARRMERKNIENQHRPVNDTDLAACVEFLFQILDLCRRQIAVKYYQPDAAAAAKLCKLTDLAGADTRPDIRRVLCLHHTRINRTARRIQQTLQLVHRNFALFLIALAGNQPHQHRLRRFNAFFLQ